MSHKKFGPDRFSRFDVYWIQTNKQTNKQTDRQAKFIYRLSASFYSSMSARRCPWNFRERNSNAKKILAYASPRVPMGSLEKFQAI